MSAITVDHNGVELSYSDSGAPAQLPYITFVAVHGLGFTNAVFKKVQAIASKSNVRFIAIVRRGYEGSTPLSEAETAATMTGTDDEKLDFLNARGIELAIFINKLIQQQGLPPITEDGKSGGVALLGWSAGNMLTIASIANLDKLSSESTARLAAYVRAHIMEGRQSLFLVDIVFKTVRSEPPPACLGLPIPPQTWSPLFNTTIPEPERTSFYMSWITSYFDNGDLSSRDINAIRYAAPSPRRPPSIYNMLAEAKALIVTDVAVPETNSIIATFPQNNVVYRKACHDASIKSLLPRMKTSVLCGDLTVSFGTSGLLALQDENDKIQGGMHFEVAPGLNHFMQWDEPEKTFELYMKLALL